MSDEAKEFKNQNIIIESREKMLITGVRDVVSFNENGVKLNTTLGALLIRGEDMSVDKLNVQTGELNVRGHVSGLVYSDDSGGRSVISRIFK